MFGLTRWNSIDDAFSFHREVDRLFNRFWNGLGAAETAPSEGFPTWTAAGQSRSLQVNTSDDGWRIDVPLPGIDPENVVLESAGNTLSIRAEEKCENNEQSLRYEQSFTVPEFLDLDKITASHKHGLLRLTLPLKEAVKPRRIRIEGVSTQKQLAA
jgi:HSP20 family protein